MSALTALSLMATPRGRLGQRNVVPSHIPLENIFIVSRDTRIFSVKSSDRNMVVRR